MHLTGTNIWCDARRSRGVWFCSGIDRVDRRQRAAIGRGEGQLIATRATLDMLERGAELAPPYRQRFTLGTLRLELVPSGRGLGTAALWVDDSGRRMLYAGSIRTRGGGLGEAGEVRTADAVVIGCPFGEPRHSFTDVREQVLAWVRAAKNPVLFVDTLLDALEVAAFLASHGHAIVGPQALRELAPIAQVHAPSVPLITAPKKMTGGVAIWLDSERAAAMKQLPGATTALVSGRAVDGTHGLDAAFAWAGAAGHAELMSWIEATSAREVYATGPYARAVVDRLGPRARVLGPPEQMQMFR